MNWVQRSILGVAGLLLLLFAFGEATDYLGSGWLASGLFLASVTSFYLAARSTK